MPLYLSIDESGNWKFIAVVVFSGLPEFSVKPHIAGLNRKYRFRVLNQVLNYIDNYGYGVCLRADILGKVRALARRRIRKRDAWNIVIAHELLRIANHLKSKGYKNFHAVYADLEFELHRKTLQRLFATDNVYIGKTREILLSDALSYANLIKLPLKQYRNISEL